MNPRPTSGSNPAFSNLDDESLAAELTQGQHEALAVLFERHSRSVFLVSRQILRDYGEAEEVVQQVFLETYERISQFDPQKGRFRSWLLKNARHRAIDRKRQLKSRGVYSWTELSEELSHDRPMLELSRQEISHLIAESLAVLSAKERQVLELRLFKGLAFEEIHVQTKETLPAVRNRYYAAINKLRAMLEASDRKESGPQNIKTKGDHGASTRIL
jgi:RNA polymerase sigma-70 factor (ECF subfamily)